jgi:hypothetical protein
MSKYTKALLSTLLISWLLRIILIFSGGQNFWPDERRYEASRAVASDILAGNIKVGLLNLHDAINPLFKALGVIPAFLENFLGEDLVIPALFFSLFSVLNLYLLWKIVIALGGSERQALFSALLLSVSATFFYYSRHLLPYDSALFFSLLSVLVGIRANKSTTQLTLSGFFALLSFLTYSGYWTLGVFALVISLHLYQAESLKEIVSRGIFFGVGFTMPLGILLAGSVLFIESTPLHEQFLSFSGTISQGLFSEGWRLPFEYLWHAEHGLLLFWAGSLLFGMWQLRKGKPSNILRFALLGLALIYGMLVTFSNGLEIFVVYGRLARQLVPFFCILGGLTLQVLWSSGEKLKQAAIVVLAVLLVQAGSNFYQPMVQQFPIGFREGAETIVSSLDEDQYVFLYAEFLHPNFAVEGENEVGKIQIQSEHPLEFLPYQYEGYTPIEREKIRGTDIKMRLIVND